MYKRAQYSAPRGPVVNGAPDPTSADYIVFLAWRTALAAFETYTAARATQTPAGSMAVHDAWTVYAAACAFAVALQRGYVPPYGPEKNP